MSSIARVPDGSSSKRSSTKISDESVSNCKVMPAPVRAICRNKPGCHARQEPNARNCSCVKRHGRYHDFSSGATRTAPQTKSFAATQRGCAPNLPCFMRSSNVIPLNIFHTNSNYYLIEARKRIGAQFMRSECNLANTLSHHSCGNFIKSSNICTLHKIVFLTNFGSCRSCSYKYIMHNVV